MIHNCCMKYLDDYEWPPLANVVLNSQIKFLKNVLKSKIPALSPFVSFDCPHNYSLRDNNNLPVKRFNKKIGQQSFSYWASKIYNLHIKLEVKMTIQLYDLVKFRDK